MVDVLFLGVPKAKSSLIVLPEQRRNYPNSRDAFLDGVWFQQCITCGMEAGDCDHTLPDEEEEAPCSAVA